MIHQGQESMTQAMKSWNTNLLHFQLKEMGTKQWETSVYLRWKAMPLDQEPTQKSQSLDQMFRNTQLVKEGNKQQKQKHQVLDNTIQMII